MKPTVLGEKHLADDVLQRDRKSCRHFGPCGVGEKALYLSSFYLERRFYVPFENVSRVYKRIAMSRGGFTGKGMFASMAYLVVEYGNGREKACIFKYEEQVDQMMACLRATHPEIRLLSAEGEERLAKRERERMARKLPVLPEEAEESIRRLKKAQDYLEKRPDLTSELSRSARRKRSFLQSNPAYGQAALAITLLGAVSLIYGIISLIRRSSSFSIYFTLFGLAAIFLFSGFSMLPTAENNRRAVLGRADRAVASMDQYIAGYGEKFPVPGRYAHPVVIARMIRAIEEGRANGESSALEDVKRGLQRLNSSVEVDQEEYDEVVAVKAMFLNAEYR